MAFVRENLSLMAYTGAGTDGQRRYHYTNEAADDITVASYFDDAAEQIYDNDIIVDGNNGERYLATNDGAGGISVAVVIPA